MFILYEINIFDFNNQVKTGQSFYSMPILKKTCSLLSSTVHITISNKYKRDPSPRSPLWSASLIPRGSLISRVASSAWPWKAYSLVTCKSTSFRFCQGEHLLRLCRMRTHRHTMIKMNVHFRSLYKGELLFESWHHSEAPAIVWLVPGVSTYWEFWPRVIMEHSASIGLSESTSLCLCKNSASVRLYHWRALRYVHVKWKYLAQLLPMHILLRS